jgi:hypothetical protein
MHSKCILFSNGYAAMGSANLTDSKFNELIVCDYLKPEDCKKVKEHFDMVFSKSQELK